MRMFWVGSKRRSLFARAPRRAAAQRPLASSSRHSTHKRRSSAWRSRSVRRSAKCSASTRPMALKRVVRAMKVSISASFQQPWWHSSPCSGVMYGLPLRRTVLTAKSGRTSSLAEMAVGVTDKTDEIGQGAGGFRPVPPVGADETDVTGLSSVLSAASRGFEASSALARAAQSITAHPRRSSG